LYWMAGGREVDCEDSMTSNHKQTGSGRYVLATAAYNEEGYIENLIRSVVAQTHPPECWTIVSDGSTDRTDEIVKDYAAKHKFVRLHRITEDHPRNFVAQVHAINTGFAKMKPLEFEFIGNLDADVTLDPPYFKDLLAKFQQEPRLGLAGGYIFEEKNGVFESRKANSPMSVAHAIQLFRRECLEQIGGSYVPMPYGGPDWQAEVNARLHGWDVHAFTDLPVYHNRPTGAAAGLLKTCYREGLMDHSVGSHPYFELFRVARRLGQSPFLVGATVRLWAYCKASIQRSKRPVPREFIDFLRKYEMNRLKNLVGARNS
jgi:poly-beta-1,6-N-acetyl-D-glucosamine synthase